jgi:MATE family multidrug resistance protein
MQWKCEDVMSSSQPVALDYDSTGDVSPLRELLGLAVPTVAQMVSYTVMQFIDAWMLAHKLGELAPTAASNAGGLSFAFIGFGVGALLVVNTLVSQSYGHKNYVNCGRYLWQGVWFALAYSLVLLPLIPLINRSFAWFKHEPQLVAMEQVYVYFTIGSAGIKLVQVALSQFMLATNRPGKVLISTVIGVCVNALVAWVLVFGMFGFREMGIIGAAWALVLGTAT